MDYKHHIISQHSIFVMLTDGTTKTIQSSNKNFKRVKTLIQNRDFKTAVELLNGNPSKIKIKTKQVFTFKNGDAYYKNEKLPKSIAVILKKFVDANIPATAVINFWNRLKKNPREFARNELMLFLEHSGIPLCEDGCFITYKVTKDDYTDCHTGTISNKPGTKIPRMKISDVEHDRTLCNAKGYHVASWNYLRVMGYPSSSRRLVECKIDPVDVVSIPYDYNNAKMRVSYYEVVGEITGQTSENPEVLYDKTTVKKMSKMRIIVPSSFLQKIRCNEGNVVSVIVDKGKLTVIKGKKGIYNYHVDTSSNIRISKTILELADMLKHKQYSMYHDKENHCIVIEPKEN